METYLKAEEEGRRQNPPGGHPGVGHLHEGPAGSGQKKWKEHEKVSERRNQPWGMNAEQRREAVLTGGRFLSFHYTVSLYNKSEVDLDGHPFVSLASDPILPISDAALLARPQQSASAGLQLQRGRHRGPNVSDLSKVT